MRKRPVVFVNYRSNDIGWAVHVDDVLVRRFGRGRVFRAGASILASQDFSQQIVDAVLAPKILVAVIGPTWITAQDRRGRRALEQADDWVRREIAIALKHGIPVLPCLVGEAAPITVSQVPTELAVLPKLQYVRMSQRSVDADTDRLVGQMVQLVPELAAINTRRRLRAPVVIAALIVTIAFGLFIAPRPSSHEGVAAPGVGAEAHAHRRPGCLIQRR